MEGTTSDATLQRAPISVTMLGVVVVLYAMAWYVLYILFESDLLMKALATPFFVMHVMLGVGLVKGWNWARVAVIIIATIGLLISLALMYYRNQDAVFILYLVALFIAALVILFRSAAREYFHQHDFMGAVGPRVEA